MAKKLQVAVFCGSEEGYDPIYKQHAERVGKLLGEYNMDLIYGGGAKGLMGIIANSAMEAGSKVTGIIPNFMVKLEWGHKGLHRLKKIKSMSKRNAMGKRKKILEKKADILIALAGGIGTLDELHETACNKKLGIHRKLIGVLNTKGIYDHLFAQIDHLKKEGFWKSTEEPEFIIEGTPEELFESLKKNL